jgi:serine/threonine protein kinase
MRSVPTHRNALPQGFRLQEYVIDSLLGHGGFGITYLAKDTHLNQWVAIKEYLPNELAVREGVSTVYAKSTSDENAFQWGLQRFITEAQTLARFKHRNIVRVLRFFEAHGTAYMVMEYEDGDNLADYLNDRSLTKEELLAIVLPLLDGLTQIHAEGFLHRDIKPNNIFIRHDGSPVLLDFGAARYAVGQKTTSLTSIVSPGYAPFEQYDPNTPQGPWSDIYALGGVMYFAITGERPKEVVGRLKCDDMRRASDLCAGRYPVELLKAVDWALAVDEQARPQSVAEWREALLSPPLAPVLPPRPRPRRDYLRLMLGVALLLLVFSCVYFCYPSLSALLPEIPRQNRSQPFDQASIEKFVASYLQVSAASHDNLPALLQHYADTVVYYSWGAVTHNEIMRDKKAFFNAWPEIDYRIDGPLEIKDMREKNAKHVSFYVDFRTHNPATGKTRTGRRLRVLLLRNRPLEGIRIIEEREYK